MASSVLDELQPHFEAIARTLSCDLELRSAVGASTTARQPNVISFAIVSSDTHGTSAPCIVVRLETNSDSDVESKLYVGNQQEVAFCLQARPEDWQAFFKPGDQLVRPYQSYWGMLRVLGPLHPEVCIIGDTTVFARYTRVWRIALDCIRKTICSGPSHEAQVDVSLPPGEETEEDAITGKYIWINHSEYGKTKIFYETSGTGSQILLFLHTAGSDSRQYHSLMNNAQCLSSYTMYAFDLPCHGRSSLGTRQVLEDYALTEQSYLESIKHVITRLNLSRNNNLILCGASMAGHVCLAAAIYAKDLGVRGAIPCEGCAHLPFSQPIYELRGADSAVLDPERVCGMIAPSSPEYFKRQIWWQYSSQGIGVFKGDLKFYFKGWDGRERMSEIDTGYCPVYMLTGEYDYSCTTEASQETSEMIAGARFERMEGLGHFPLTENPAKMLHYLSRAVSWIQQHGNSGEANK